MTNHISLAAIVPELANQNPTGYASQDLRALAQAMPILGKYSYSQQLCDVITSSPFDEIYQGDILEQLIALGIPFEKGIFVEGPYLQTQKKPPSQNRSAGFWLQYNKTNRILKVSTIFGHIDSERLQQAIKMRVLAPGLFYHKQSGIVFDYNGTVFHLSLDPTTHTPFGYSGAYELADALIASKLQDTSKQTEEEKEEERKRLVTTAKNVQTRFGMFVLRLVTLMARFPEMLTQAPTKPVKNAKKHKKNGSAVKPTPLWLNGKTFRTLASAVDPDDIREALGIMPLRVQERIPLSLRLPDHANFMSAEEYAIELRTNNAKTFLNRIAGLPPFRYKPKTYSTVRQVMAGLTDQELLECARGVVPFFEKYVIEGPYSPPKYAANLTEKDALLPQSCAIVHHTATSLTFSRFSTKPCLEIINSKFCLNEHPPKTTPRMGWFFDQRHFTLNWDQSGESGLQLFPYNAPEQVDYARFLLALATLRCAAEEIVGELTHQNAAEQDLPSPSSDTPESTRRAVFMGQRYASFRGATDPDKVTRMNLTNRDKPARRVLRDQKEFELTETNGAWEFAKAHSRKAHGRSPTPANCANVFHELDEAAAIIFGDHISVQISPVATSRPPRYSNGTIGKPRSAHWRATLVYRESDPRYAIRKGAYELVANEFPTAIRKDSHNPAQLVLDYLKDPSAAMAKANISALDMA